MPIEYHIDHDKRLVVAAGRGVLTDEEMFGYQREVWTRADVLGYNELVDMTQVASINSISVNRIEQLARLSAQMDTPAVASKFAIVASADLHFALGRMYQVHRAMEAESTKQVAVFRTLAEALDFLGVSGDALDNINWPTP